MGKRRKSKEIKWFARGGGIAKCGPFDTQLEATNAMRLVEDKGFPQDVFVWPEETDVCDRP
jgi:hypothetical protein